MNGFFNKYPPENNSVPLKRVLSLHGEELNKRHPDICKFICGELVWRLKLRFDNPGSQKLLIDLVGQLSLLAPAAFAWGFLYMLMIRTELTLSSMATKKPLKKG